MTKEQGLIKRDQNRKIREKTPKTLDLLFLCPSFFLSLLHNTSVCDCVQLREGASLFILVSQLTFSLIGSTYIIDRSDLPRKSHNNNYIIIFWEILTRLTIEGLPHELYMAFYISNISRRRNNNNVEYK